MDIIHDKVKFVDLVKTKTLMDLGVGKATVEVGLATARYPRLYDRNLRNGSEESTLNPENLVQISIIMGTKRLQKKLVNDK